MCNLVRPESEPEFSLALQTRGVFSSTLAGPAPGRRLITVSRGSSFRASQ